MQVAYKPPAGEICDMQHGCCGVGAAEVPARAISSFAPRVYSNYMGLMPCDSKLPYYIQIELSSTSKLAFQTSTVCTADADGQH